MNLNNIDFNKLAVFSRVVEAGNYRLASEVLNVTPSAISQTISSLEHSLGILLFHRIGKRLVLTEAGAEIQREFQLHYSSLAGALARIAGKDQQVTGLLHVGSYLEFAKFQLAPILTTFQRQHPDARVKLVFDTPTRLHRLLEAGKLDLCFSIYPEKDSKLIQSTPIYRQELVLVSPKGLIAERPSFDEVVAAPMVEYYFNHQPIRRWLAFHFQKKPRQLPIRTFGATAEMVLTLVQEGLGIGVVPEYLLRGKALRSLVVCRPTPKKLMDSIWMLQLKGRSRSPALAAFTQAVTKALQAERL